MVTRRYDPDRRARLADAAVRVISRDGIAGLSHRAVAAEAQVPLGSTTYHYRGLDDLLLAALRQVNDAWLERFRAWVEAVDRDQPLAVELARFVADSLAEDGRSRVELEYEFYFAGLRHRAVRPLAAECVERMVTLIRRHVPEEARARAVIGLLDGTLIQLMLTGRRPDHDELCAVFRGLFPEDGTGSPGGARAG